MKSKVAFGCFLIAIFVTARAAVDDRAIGMLRKADEILHHATVVSNRAVGYAGVCPEANWALSVICASKDDPVGHLIDLAEQCRSAGFVMCMLGLRTLDEKRFASELAKRRKKIEEAKPTVETVIGCFFEKKLVIEVLEEKGWNREWLLCDPLPELWETVRVEPITGSFNSERSDSP